MMMNRCTLLLLTISWMTLLGTASSSSSSTPSLRRNVLEEEEEETKGTETETETTDTGGFMNEEAYITKLAEKLRPYELETSIVHGQPTVQLHQFLHLHHMKTGGTSMDGLLNCAMRRLKNMQNTNQQPSQQQQKQQKQQQQQQQKKHHGNTVSYMNIHECGLNRYLKCRDGEDPRCRDQINNAAILSYCAPLMDLEAFGWTTKTTTTTTRVSGEDDHVNGTTTTTTTSTTTNDTAIVPPKEETTAIISDTTTTKPPHAVTVFRHPVDRVWSMFRFQTKRCYQCRNLTDVYAAMDDANSGAHKMDEICAQQLLNHQTRNLVSDIKWRNSTTFNNADPATEDMILEEAIDNMKNFFTLIGLTENMNDTAKMVGLVFPFMNETYTPPSDTTTGKSHEKCGMPHRNASPQNNRCGKDGRSHWDLPKHPDAATREAILQHNALDVQLYEQAVQQFQYQKMALGLMDNNDKEEGDVPNQE